MRHPRLLLLLLLLALVAMEPCTAQNQQSSTPPAGNQQLPEATAVPQVQPSPVRILAPAPGQMLPDPSVRLRFELMRPAPSGEPIFLIQLDGDDPINTSDTEYAFPDLQPGTHTLQVALVDANNRPIEGASATVKFKVLPEQPAPGKGTRGALRHATGTTAAAGPKPPIPPELHNSGDINFPLKGSPLPLIAVVGFGLLIGVVTRAMRAHKGPVRRVTL